MADVFCNRKNEAQAHVPATNAFALALQYSPM